MNFTEDTLAAEVFGVPDCDATTMVDELLDGLTQCCRWQSHLAWASYVRAALLHLRTAERPPEKDRRLVDDEANTALHLSTIYHLPKTGSDTFLREALALIRRIPRIGQCLKDGVITQAQYRELVALTALIDGTPHASDVDEAIARELRGTGAASKPRLRDMADRIIYRHDPDGVRNRRDSAIRNRTAASRRLSDGMAQVGIITSAEDAALAMAAVQALSASVCSHDPRTPNARRSDAAVCRLQAIPFTCQCERDDCTANVDEQPITDGQARIVLHAIWEVPYPGGTSGWPENPAPPSPDSGGRGGDGPTSEAPVDDDSASAASSTETAESESEPAEDAGADHDSFRAPPARVPRSRQLGFLDGYGVISADHIRDIATRPDTIFRPLNTDPSQPLPTHLPSDPYRFSTALDTFIRARDVYCVFPGCPRPAWACDLDHVTEFDHRNPADGGRTSQLNGNAKCRYHHIAKTFSNWLDDQYLGGDGRTHTEFITPSGYRFHGHGHTTEDLFPALRDIRFEDPPPPDRQDSEMGAPSEGRGIGDPTRAGPQRRSSRHADKLARRRHERKLNRLHRENSGSAKNPGHNGADDPTS